MSWWRRLFGREPARAPDVLETVEPGADADVDTPARDADVDTPARDAGARALVPDPRPRDAASPEDVAERELLRRLAAVERPDGASALEALTALRGATDTVREAAVLDAVVAGLEAAAPTPALEPVRVAAAALLSLRGHGDRALGVAGGCHGAEGMLLASDLAAARGELARALGTIERVLARAYDLPGARERHARWSAQLGRARGDRSTGRDAPTAVRPSAPAVGFRLLREVARGGAGTVYEAEDELLGRRLALKMFHGGAAAREAILREARLTARLAGPGVVRLFDADAEAGWIASEWVALGSLRDLLQAGRVAEVLPLEGWLPALARALARVHGAGLVHADLKPSNVLFRQLDEPLLGDFGSARTPGAEERGGTAGFLSPERIAGAPADARDDVYAFGRILEDVLAAADARVVPDRAARLHRLVALCLGSERPADGPALVAALAHLAPADEPRESTR
ncbi:MAG: serine/threonine protein kinase [Polyangiaceae bacterium]|nr:serine/threonine protein kinase [Polyangiaceae bacterium]